MLKYLLSGGSDFNQGSFQSCGKFSDKKARQVGTDLLVIGERCAKATALGCRGVSLVLRWAQTTRSPWGCCSTRGSAGQGSSSPELSSSLSPGLRDVSRCVSGARCCGVLVPALSCLRTLPLAPSVSVTAASSACPQAGTSLRPPLSPTFSRRWCRSPVAQQPFWGAGRAQSREQQPPS